MKNETLQKCAKKCNFERLCKESVMSNFRINKPLFNITLHSYILFIYI